MSRAIRGTGKFNVEFDRRTETIQKLYAECFDEEGRLAVDPGGDPGVRVAELESEVEKLCDWINSDPSVRRNLDGRHFVELLKYRRCRPEHEVWSKVVMMIRTRMAQNSAGRKYLLWEQREANLASK